MGAPTNRPGWLAAEFGRQSAGAEQVAQTQAVPVIHPDELAAQLEADGLTDVLARQQFGQASVFAYAEHLFRTQPDAALPARLADPGDHGTAPAPVPWNGLLRGVVYALPGAPMALAVSLLATTGAPRGLSYALIAAVILSWGWGQGAAVIGYRLSGAAQQRFVQRATLAVVPLGALLGAVLTALFQPDAMTTDVLRCALITAVAAGALSASSSLLILRLVPLALLAYLPACAALLGQAAGHPFPPDLALGALLYAVLLPLAALFLNAPGPVGPVLPRAGWAVVGGHALSAWACAGFVALTWGLAPGSPGWAQGALPLLLPVILSLGVMEVLTELTFRGLRRHAARHHSLTAVRRRAWRSALDALFIYTAALLALLLLSVGLTRPEILHQPAELLLLIFPALLYGAALMLGTLSGSTGAAWWTLSAWLLGIAALLGPLAGPPYGALLAAALPLTVMAIGVNRALQHPHTYL